MSHSIQVQRFDVKINGLKQSNSLKTIKITDQTLHIQNIERRNIEMHSIMKTIFDSSVEAFTANSRVNTVYSNVTVPNTNLAFF